MIRLVRQYRQIVPGVVADTRGAFHVDIPRRLQLLGLADTKQNRRDCGLVEITQLREALPRTLIIAHLEGLPQ